MEESVPGSSAWWKYLVWTALIVAVFFSSIVVGHWWNSRSYRAAQEPTNTTSDTPTQRMPGPVVLEVASELEAVRLQSSVDTAALEQWWQILGVDSQALTFKELGGWATYTPQSVNIVIKDISPPGQPHIGINRTRMTRIFTDSHRSAIF